MSRTKEMMQQASIEQSDADLDQRYTLDARQCGNVARFINHSSTPNLFVQMVCSESRDPRQPHLCLFANSLIPSFTELCYDYGNAYADRWLS